MRRRWPQLSLTTTYGLAVSLAAIVSLGGVVWAGLSSTDKSDGGRGGAIAVIVSLCVFFLRRDYSERVIDSTLELYPELAKHIENAAEGYPIEPFSPSEATALLLGMFGRMNVESTEQHGQNITLFWTSFIGTIFWGFGDIPTGWMILYRSHPH